MLVCIRSVLKDNNSTDQMLKYTSFYAVKGQYTQRGCKQDRFCTSQPFAHCTLTSNSDTVPLILSHIYSFEFPWAERTFRKKTFYPTLSQLCLGNVFSSQGNKYCCSVPCHLVYQAYSQWVLCRCCLDTLATGVLDSRRQNYHFKDLQCPHWEAKVDRWSKSPLCESEDRYLCSETSSCSSCFLYNFVF